MGRPKGSVNPDIWLSGPDLADHKLFNDCQRARAQAWYRGEQLLITEQEYIALWRKDDQHLLRGRSSTSLCMTRLDADLPWCLTNVIIISRLDHYRTCNNLKGGHAYKRTRNHVQQGI